MNPIFRRQDFNPSCLPGELGLHVGPQLQAGPASSDAATTPKTHANTDALPITSNQPASTLPTTGNSPIKTVHPSTNGTAATKPTLPSWAAAQATPATVAVPTLISGKGLYPRIQPAQPLSSPLNQLL